MRHHLLRPAAIAAVTAVAAVSATTGIAAPAAVLAATAATTTRTAAAESTAAVSPAGSRAVFLINGDQLGLSAPQALGACISIFDVAVSGPASQLRTLTIGGKSYVMPTAAVPYLGRGLDPSLFDLSALTRAESAGRLPVQLSYSGRVPALPGVTITTSGAATAEGYLTAAGARTFGTALARQLAADHRRGSYGQDGLFAGGVSVALRGAAPAPPRPRYVMHTLIVDGTNLAGKPDTGDTVWLFNVDNASKFDDFIATLSVFYHGVAKFSVPAGHYWAIGDFITIHRKPSAFDDHLAVLPELTAGRATTVHLDARSASSKIQLVTPRSAVPLTTGFSMLRTGAAGPAIGIGWSTLSLGPGAALPSLYVNPTTAAPATGTLTDVTSGQLNSPPSAPGIPYQYNVAYQSRGIIPVQRFMVHQAALATENARYYSANSTTGYLARQPVFPSQQSCYSVTYFSTRFPARQTVYLSAGPSLRWIENYAQSTKGFGPGSGGQSGVPRAFLPGQRLTEDWGAYPLHPAPFVRLGQIPGAPPVPVSANRAGDTLRLALNAFSDNTPGHTGVGVYPPFTATGRYEIDQNWTKIAGGNLAHFAGFFYGQAKLSPARSLIRVVLNSAEPAKLNPLSTASRTVWTWWSAHESGATLPAGWSCQVFPLTDRACAAQPMMTLRYGVTGMGLNGATSPGQQVVRVSVAHLQLAAAPKVTSVAVFASLDGGKTWRAARVTGSAGSYAAVFPAPAGARVTLRTTAADASGGSVTETVTNAYQVAP